MRVCSRCGASKPESEFYRARKGRDGLTARCKGCTSAEAAAYRKTERYKAVKAAWNALPDSRAKQRRWIADNRDRSIFYQRKYKYGITRAEFETMLATQNNTCLLCGQPFGDSKGRRPAVDHDHTTGRVRGILHGMCNIGLGSFNDSSQLLDAARFYLKWYGKK